MAHKVKEAFDSIHAEEQLKKSTKEFIAKELDSKRGRKTNLKDWYIKEYQLAVAAVCFLFIIVGAGGYNFYFTEVSAISIDINPSIELGINRFDQVISVEGYNEDGDKLAESLDIRFMNYIEAIDEILKNEKIAAYLLAEEQLSITVVGDDEEKRQEMFTNVNACASSHENVYCHSGNANEVEAAHQEGLSFGKYQAFLELQALDASILAEDVKGLTMREIREWIAVLSGVEENGISSKQKEESDSLDNKGYENDCDHKEHGNGHGESH